jgi:L-amino acid N-acyltransferase YncA
MKIIQTLPGDDLFNHFERLPVRLYSEDLLKMKLPESMNMEFIQSCLVMMEDGQPIARVAIYNNPELSYLGKKSICFGNYECIDNIEVGKALLSYAAKESKLKEAEFIIGPMNGSTWDNYRFSLHNDHANFLLEPYHHLYYNDHFTQAGFAPIADYISSFDRTLTHDSDDGLELEERFVKAGVTIRSIRTDDYENELRKLFPFISSAFSRNFLYTPIAWSTFLKKYKEAAQIIQEEFVLIAEDHRCNIIGFIFCYQDHYHRNEKSLVVKTLARAPDRQWAGLGHVLANRVISNAKRNNYAMVVHAFMIEEATSRGLSNNFLGTVYKNYRLYGKEL